MSLGEYYEKEFDPCLKDLGFDVSPTPLGSGRLVLGQHSGVPLEIAFSPRRRTKYIGSDIRRTRYVGHQLTIVLTHDFNTRLIISPLQSAPLSSIRRRLFEYLDIKEFAPGELSSELKVFCADIDWANAFWNHPSTQSVFAPGFFLPEAKFSSLSLTPDTLILSMRVYPGDLKSEQLGRWIKSLVSLVEVAREIEPPAKVSKLTWLEVKGRQFGKYAKGSPIKAACMLLGLGFLLTILLSPIFILSLPITMPLLIIFVLFRGFKKTLG
jgi:hypothetical protein